MSKTSLIIQREYLSRVKKKSFLVMTILGPVLFAALLIVPILLSNVSDKPARVVIVDNTGLYFPALENSEKVKFLSSEHDLLTTRKIYKDSSDVSVLFIPENVISQNPVKLELYSQKQPGVSVVSHISASLQSAIEKDLLRAENVDPEVFNKTKRLVNISTIVKNEVTNNELNIAVAFIGGILIYLFIFLYSAQVMRGVIEEKTNRIVEVIISSVKPFQLMMGKIIGVAMVGLTQFLLWIVLSVIIIFSFQTFVSEKEFDKVVKSKVQIEMQKEEVSVLKGKEDEILESISRINWPFVLGSFIFYFLGGYLLYSALFAAVGSAVDNETETQQFMLPVTIPLILSFVMAEPIMKDPNGPVAFWLSMIPLTSPVAMMVRIAFFDFSTDWWQLVLSAVLLILGFIFTTWIAGRIYRTGILMYGKKVSYSELWKWLFYRG